MVGSQDRKTFILFFHKPISSTHSLKTFTNWLKSEIFLSFIRKFIRNFILIRYSLFTTESWFWIWRPIVVCLFFVFVSTGNQDKSKLVFPSFSRLHVLGGAFLALSPAPFSIVLCHPTPNSRPKEFRLVFASLAVAAPLDGQPHRRRLFQFCSCCLVQNFIVCFSASFIRSHRFVLFVINCIFAVNTIQCSDCCRVGRQNLCSSFLSNILWCIDRESLPIVLAVISSSSPAW